MQSSSRRETRPPSPAVGYALVVASILFLLVGSYAVFFSAFVPLTGVWVRGPLLDPEAVAADTHIRLLSHCCRWPRPPLALKLEVPGRARAGHALQVPRGHARRRGHGLRHRELGRVAVLQKFVRLSSKVAIGVAFELHTLYGSTSANAVYMYDFVGRQLRPPIVGASLLRSPLVWCDVVCARVSGTLRQTTLEQASKQQTTALHCKQDITT